MTVRLFVTLLLISGLPVWAADAGGNYAIWGLGRTSCHQYVKAVAANDDQSHRDYLMGYLTAFNTLSDDTYDVTGGGKLGEVTGWLANYCDLHPIESFDRAIQQFVSERFDGRLQTPPGRSRGWGGNAVDE